MVMENNKMRNLTDEDLAKKLKSTVIMQYVVFVPAILVITLYTVHLFSGKSVSIGSFVPGFICLLFGIFFTVQKKIMVQELKRRENK